MAAAANLLGIPATIVMPIDAPEIKRKKTESYGANIVLSDHGSRPREEVASETARAIAKVQRMTLLHPFDAPLIITGHAGAAVEVVKELNLIGENLPDIVLCGVGGGGFAAGLAMVFHHLAPDIELFVVEPQGYDSLGSSIANKQDTRIPGDKTTICDALQATAPGKAPFACAQFACVQSRLTVRDYSVIQAMQFAFENLMMVLEPSGAAGIAGMLEHPDNFLGKRVVAFTTGGNITIEDFTKILSIDEYNEYPIQSI